MNENELENMPEPINRHTPEPTVVKKAAPWPWIAVALLAVAALIFVLVRDGIVETSVASGNEVVGRIDGAAITKLELFDELAKQMGNSQMASMLDGIIMQKMLELEANSMGIKVNDAEVDGEIADYKSQFDSEDQFEGMLQQYGMSLDELKKQVVVTLKVRKIFEPQIQPTEEQLKQHYENNLASFETSAEQVRASHILLATEEEANAVLAELRNGADFAATASAKSTDTGSKDNGGDLDYFTRGVMTEPFETAAFELEIGEMSGVVASSFGYHIIQVTDKKEAVTQTFEEARTQVKNDYLDQEISNRFGEWVEEKKKAYNYENLLAEAVS